jgi:hypothetical protein
LLSFSVKSSAGAGCPAGVSIARRKVPSEACCATSEIASRRAIRPRGQ